MINVSISMLLLFLGAIQYWIYRIKHQAKQAKDHLVHVSEYIDHIQPISSTPNIHSSDFTNSLQAIIKELFDTSEGIKEVVLVFSDEFFAKKTPVLRFANDQTVTKDDAIREHEQVFIQIVNENEIRFQKEHALVINKKTMSQEMAQFDQSVVVLNLFYKTKMYGNLLIKLTDNVTVSEDRLTFYKILGHLISYTLRKFEVEIGVPIKHQMEAVNITW